MTEKSKKEKPSQELKAKLIKINPSKRPMDGGQGPGYKMGGGQW